MRRDHILDEIRRTAEANGGKPLGRARFERATGIREADWSGIHWARWGDAVREAGLEPNVLQGRYPDEEVLESLVELIREHRKMPTESELRLYRRTNPKVPSSHVFERLGRKVEWAAKVADYCSERSEHADVLAIVEPLIASSDDAEEREVAAPDDIGFVYLLKSGKHYKIGRTNSVGRRAYDLAIQLPEAVTRIHEIRTDDPAGIERYWHERFADQRLNGEWFELSAADVAAFKRRQFQ